MLVGTSLIALTLLFLLSPLFEVKSISVRRQDTRVDIEEIQQLLLPFFGRHLFFLSQRLLEETVQSAYPEVASVKVAKHFPHEVRLTLYMDPIVADVLVGAPEETEYTLASSGSGLSQYLTSRGIYLEYETPLGKREKEGERMRLQVVDWAVKPSHRQQLLSEDALHAMQSAEKILRESFGHTIAAVVLYVRAQEFHMQTEHFSLWFDMATPLVQQIDHYREFLRSLSAESAVEYIDLRLHDRVVYR